jgi:hypothetical protein
MTDSGAYPNGVSVNTGVGATRLTETTPGRQWYRHVSLIV